MCHLPYAQKRATLSVAGHRKNPEEITGKTIGKIPGKNKAPWIRGAIVYCNDLKAELLLVANTGNKTGIHH